MIICAVYIKGVSTPGNLSIRFVKTFVDRSVSAIGKGGQWRTAERLSDK